MTKILAATSLISPATCSKAPRNTATRTAGIGRTVKRLVRSTSTTSRTPSSDRQPSRQEAGLLRERSGRDAHSPDLGVIVNRSRPNRFVRPGAPPPVLLQRVPDDRPSPNPLRDCHWPFVKR